MESILWESDDDDDDDDDKQQSAVSEAIELILTFAETFVEQTASLEDQNKRLLGKIVKTVSDKDKTAYARE